ncbi:MAG: hypothetical protein QOG65_3519 [Actinomycetota bacterium]|nr:hypothetical protein [Actinomycetota bacterium]MDQ1386140.1 hypothetical protein [Actinomycetota bacterium]
MRVIKVTEPLAPLSLGPSGLTQELWRWKLTVRMAMVDVVVSPILDIFVVVPDLPPRHRFHVPKLSSQWAAPIGSSVRDQWLVVRAAHRLRSRRSTMRRVVVSPGVQSR